MIRVRGWWGIGAWEDKALLTVGDKVNGNGKIKERTVLSRDMALRWNGGLNGREQGILKSP